MNEREQYIANCKEQIKRCYQELFDLVGDPSDYAKRIRPAIRLEIAALDEEIRIATAGAMADSIIKIF